MGEHDALIASYSHLADFARPNEALQTLKKIASIVKPIMRARKWKVRKLAEFYPDQPNLLGVNWDKGKKICLRLRYPGDKTQFLPWENVLDTMLHELCHNVIGPHNQAFHKLWDTLREEMEGLLMKGYTGEGFLSDGRRLGGSNKRIPHDEARRLARQAAEERRRGQALTAGSGQRLGGKAPRPGKDIRKVIADAAQRRNETLKGCGSEKMNDEQIRDLADTATANGFRTKAEEDEANEVAIAQAMWELVQEDEKAKYGSDYVSPTPQNPAGGSSSTTSSSSYGQKESNSGPSNSGTPSSVPGDIWICNVCTLHNPRNFLACDACGTERSGEQSQKAPQQTEGKQPEPTKSSKRAESKKPDVVDLTVSPPRKRDEKRRRFEDGPIQGPTGPYVPPFWHCNDCGTKMERRWWTCSSCGRMKESS